MKGVLIVFFTLLLLIFLLILPFKVRMMGHFNLIEMKGFYSIKVLFIKILNGKIEFQNGKIIVDNSVNFLGGKMNKRFARFLMKKLLASIDVKKLELYFTGGTAYNSFSSAMICGSMCSLVQTIYSFLSNKFDNVKLFEEISPTFNETNFELTFDACVAISLLQVLLSLIGAEIEKKKEVKNEG